ncbi:MAG: hypothetical protein OHK0045_24280 [Raineya sp.]
MNQLNFFQRREFGEIVGFSFQFVKQNFFHYFVNILLLHVPLIVLLIGAGFYIFENFPIEQVISGLRFGGVAPIIGFLMAFFALVLFWLSYTSAVSYNYYLLYIEKGSKNFSLQDLFAAALASIWRLLIANFILGLMLFVIFVLFTVLVGVGQGVPAVLLAIALFAFGVYYSIKMAFFQLIVVREKLNVFEAIARSMKITEGSWWQTFGLFFVFGIISYLISNIVNTILGLFGLEILDVTTFVDREIPQIEAMSVVVFAIAQVVVSVFSNMFSQTGFFAQYGNLLEEKEGVGLKNKVEQIGKTQDNESEEEDF